MAGARILLVEDDDVLRDVVSRNLRARAYDLEEAVDVKSALDHLRAQVFDLILLDINLPDQTGWDVLRIALQEQLIHPLDDPERPGVLPIVVLSAVRANPRRLSEFRPLAYLPKPFPMEALLRLASEAAERHRLRIEPSSSNK